MPEKETDKGLMHSFFGGELCDACKGIVVVAYIAPTQKDITSFAEVFSRLRKATDVQGEELVQNAIAAADAHGTPPQSSFKDSPGADQNKKKTE